MSFEYLVFLILNIINIFRYINFISDIRIPIRIPIRFSVRFRFFGYRNIETVRLFLNFGSVSDLVFRFGFRSVFGFRFLCPCLVLLVCFKFSIVVYMDTMKRLVLPLFLNVGSFSKKSLFHNISSLHISIHFFHLLDIVWPIK